MFHHREGHPHFTAILHRTAYPTLKHELRGNMATDLLTLRYTPLDELSEAFLQGNPKRHDLGQLWDSMQRYGFRDPMAFDAQLNGGKGGIVEGNGRLETLVSAYNNDQTPPRGIKLDEDGRWFVPVLYGVDGRSESEAIAYSFDHNTMVLSGGEFTALDASRLYDAEGYTALLQELANAESLPLTVDGEDLSTLIQQLNEDPFVQDENPESSAQEIDVDGFEFDCKCPKCGFEFIQQK